MSFNPISFTLMIYFAVVTLGQISIFPADPLMVYVRVA